MELSEKEMCLWFVAFHIEVYRAPADKEYLRRVLESSVRSVVLKAEKLTGY